MIHSDIRDRQTNAAGYRGSNRGRAFSLVLASGSALSAVAFMGGCNWDSFLRTNAVGRWEATTTKVPILTRIAAIEDENGLAVDAVAPTPEDLYPDPQQYRVGPGDELELEIYDIVETGSMTPYSRRVDVRGMVNIPQLGDVFVNGKTVDGVKDAISTAMKKLVEEPLVGVNVKAERQQTFVIQGAVDQPGPYFIPSPDYKLLEALTAGGRMPSSVPEVYVIRQVPIDERVERSMTPPAPPPKKGGSPFDSPIKPDAGQPGNGDEPGLMDILKDLSKPKGGENQPPAEPTKPADAAKSEPKDAPIDLPTSEGAIAPPPVKPVVPPANPAPTNPAPEKPAATPKPEQKAAPKPEHKPEPAPTTPPKETEPPVPLPDPGMMSEYAPPKDADDMARRARLKALEGKLKRPLDAPAPPRVPKPGEHPKSDEQPKPEPAPEMEPVPLDDAMEPMAEPEPAPARPVAPTARPSLTPPGPDAVVDLPEVNRRRAQPAPVPTGGESSGKSSWVYLNGRWVQVRRPGGASGDLDGLLGGGEPVGLNPSTPSGPLFAQKVIKVPLDALFRGDSNYNIVIRPGDVVRVPPPPEGEVYVAGQVLRPGSYQLSQSGGAFTVTRAIVAAGGLGDEAIPERVDLVRVVGNNQQAMMKIDLRAMYEGTQPDILLKKDDMINVGSNFWAFPLAVIRNGFRANYGFGFLLDRNFGSDVFGVPPESRSRGF